MSTTLLALVVLVAALACPAHMLWQARRGKQAAYCVPERGHDREVLRARQQADVAPSGGHRVWGEPG